jgi:hypothetical protein
MTQFFIFVKGKIFSFKSDSNSAWTLVKTFLLLSTYNAGQKPSNNTQNGQKLNNIFFAVKLHYIRCS